MTSKQRAALLAPVRAARYFRSCWHVREFPSPCWKRRKTSTAIFADTIHPNVLHLMDDLGLAERLMQLRHSKLQTVSFQTSDGPFLAADLRRVEDKFPYIMLVPQANFLEFITSEAKKYPNFRLLLGASAQELIEDQGTVRGVRYRSNRELHEVRALLTVGADGRSSRIRKLADIEPVKTSAPMDILWFRIPRDSKDPEGVLGDLGRARLSCGPPDEWQVGFVILKAVTVRSARRTPALRVQR